MKKTYKILRALIVSLIVAAFVIPAALYVALSLKSVQNFITIRAEKELSQLLNSPVEIDFISVQPFSRLTLHNVNVADSVGSPIMRVRRLGAGFNVTQSILKRKPVFDYAEIVDLNLSIKRDTPSAPTNLQPIIDALSPKNKDKAPTAFNLRFNTIVVRSSQVSYDVLSEPHIADRFDPNHIKLSSVRADLSIPQLSNDNIGIELKRLAFNEQSGATLSDLSANFSMKPTQMSVQGLNIATAHSRLCLSDISVDYSSLEQLKKSWTSLPIDVEIQKGSYVSSTDLVPFLPMLAGSDILLSAQMHLLGSPDNFSISPLSLSSARGLKIETEGTVSGLFSNNLAYDFPNIDIDLDGLHTSNLLRRFAIATDSVQHMIANIGNASISGSLSGTATDGVAELGMQSQVGLLTISGNYNRSKSDLTATIDMVVDRFNGQMLMNGLGGPLAQLTDLDATATVDLSLGTNRLDMLGQIDVVTATYNDRTINDLQLTFSKTGTEYEASLFADNDQLYASADVRATLSDLDKSIDFAAEVRNLSLVMLGIDSEHHAGRRLSLSTSGSAWGGSIDDMECDLSVERAEIYRNGKKEIDFGTLSASLFRGDDADTLSLKSDLADLNAIGTIYPSVLPYQMRKIVASVMPALIKNITPPASATNKSNNFSYQAIIRPLDRLNPILSLPIQIVEPVSIHGRFSADTNEAALAINAPYLLKGNKLIEETSINASLIGLHADSISSEAKGFLQLTTTLPTKDGGLTITSTSKALTNHIDTDIDWVINRRRRFDGHWSMSSAFSRNDNGELLTNIYINPGTMVFNDAEWTVDPARIFISPGNEIDVEGFKVWRPGQMVSIDGIASESSADTLSMKLRHVDLGYIFQTLAINAAQFGGRASGDFYATSLLTSSPIAYTDSLMVENMTYNDALLGNARIKSRWSNRRKSILLNAEITPRPGRLTRVDGRISPAADSLDLRIHADSVNAGFLQRFMAAFADEVSGSASGDIHVFGSFKNVDLVGAVHANNVRLKIAPTGVDYTVNDSIRFTPGRISFNNVTVADNFAHTAILSGAVTHDYLRDASFNINVSDARGLLMYDIRENDSQAWFGRIFGNGKASIIGQPGLVKVNVDVATQGQSSFTFSLGNSLTAQEYKFITFRDRDQARKDSIAALTAPSLAVVQLKKSLEKSHNHSSDSRYQLTFNIDVSPSTQINLIMDPSSGDKLRAYGSGVIRMHYDSANDDMALNGTYTVERGNYNFTLQDIIIKDFKIQQGSSITFVGDPNAAQLNITAKYQVKANLTDLDESFIDDKELNRTNVPVDALLLVRGDLRSPEITFDLDFPTLSEEPKRKVRSIINTDEMMNKQMIYLLALNRFYTPDYMNGAKGNELVSMASSTISSQLSNILGSLSDKWNIAPNFRSDKGDFSDVEFDVALSSRLLNNRLMLNGNFGYRDKTLNNNTFVGDFDVEYLLNRSGSWRLKAYNRYNDQNYYFKTALTTQGVGIVFKRDFDDMFSWLRKKSTTAPTDTTTTSAQ